MNTKINKKAVIIGRYQTFTLHPDQIKMIQEVVDSHSQTIIVLGNSLLRGTMANPLDFRARKTMIQEKFPNIDIFYINDIPKDDVAWSKNLDKIILDNLAWGDLVSEITIFGSKDTVVSKYKGTHKTCVFEASSFVSADELRRQANMYLPNEQFRAGMIAAQIHRYPTAYQAVDVAVVDDNGRLLLARKPNEKIWQFIGGFSDPTSPNLETDARREVSEEANIEVDGVVYLGSTLIKDSRYMFEIDKIKTAFFVAKYVFGRPEAKDDIAEVRWVPIKDLKREEIGEFHHVLLDMFTEKFLKNETLYKQYVTV